MSGSGVNVALWISCRIVVTAKLQVLGVASSVCFLFFFFTKGMSQGGKQFFAEFPLDCMAHEECWGVTRRSPTESLTSASILAFSLQLPYHIVLIFFVDCYGPLPNPVVLSILLCATGSLSFCAAWVSLEIPHSSLQMQDHPTAHCRSKVTQLLLVYTTAHSY